MKTFDVAVIGQGYAGLMVARLAREKGLDVIAFEQMFAGGFVMNVNHLDPAPEGKPAEGPDLISTLAMENMDLGIETKNAPVTGLSPQNGAWQIDSDAGQIRTRQVVIASGTRPLRLGLPGEEELIGMGVSECADCDGPMLAGQDTVVVGGGDSAFQEALTLSMFGAKVTLVLRGDKPRARPDFVARVEADPAITVLTRTEARGIERDASGLTGLRIAEAGGDDRVLPCRAMFVFVGQDPVTEFLPDQVARDERGAVVTDVECRVAEGVWAVGSVRSGFPGMLSHADADAARVVAALN